MPTNPFLGKSMPNPIAENLLDSYKDFHNANPEIIDHIKDFCAFHKVIPIFAVDTGSHYHGYANQNSDYDIQIVFHRTIEDYLAIDAKPEVIQMIPPTPPYEIVGYDLKHFLRSLADSKFHSHKMMDSSKIYFRDPNKYAILNQTWHDYLNQNRINRALKGIISHNIEVYSPKRPSRVLLALSCALKLDHWNPNLKSYFDQIVDQRNSNSISEDLLNQTLIYLDSFLKSLPDYPCQTTDRPDLTPTFLHLIGA